MADRPHVPSEVQLQLRQEAGFGCCKCGGPVYQYHHIVEYSAEPHFRPDDMMVLCPNCHDEATAGALTEREQRSHKASPYNIRHGRASGQLKVSQEVCEVELGTIRLIGNGDLVRVDGERLLGLGVNKFGALDLYLTLYDRDDNLLVRIDENEWSAVASSLPWDIESHYQQLRIRQRKGDIRLDIDARKQPMQLRANLWRKGHNIRLDPRYLLFDTASPHIQFQNFTFRGACFDIDSRTGKVSLGPAQDAAVEESTMATLLAHRDVVFEDQTIYLAGNAYFGCTFRRCTLVVRESPTVMDSCSFDGCIWHFDLLVYDQKVWEALVRDLISKVGDSLPRTQDAESK